MKAAFLTTALTAMAVVALTPVAASAGATIQIDDTHSVTIGAGLRASFAALEDGAGSGDEWSTDFGVDNARIYLSGQAHEYLEVEINTECIFCNNASLREFHLLDAIAKIEVNPYFNLWGGRLLVPSDRVEMDGPFYGNVHENFKTPFYSSDHSVDFGSGSAGVYGRDHGVNLWGAAGPEGKFQYVFGIFNGLRGLSNGDSNLLYATRLAYNFLSREQNPAYYTSSTYYGGGGDILTIAYALQYQADGAGSAENPGDFLGMSVDALFEKILEGVGVVTVEAEYKYFDADYSTAAFSDDACFCMFSGDAYTATALFLLPEKVGIGTPQPYVRYTGIEPDDSANRYELELGLNYVISGPNGRLSLFYQYGDLATRSLVNFAPGVTGEEVSALKLAIQIQI